VLAHLALAFPTGRLPGRLELRVMVGVYVWTLGNNLVRMLFYDPQAEGCSQCPPNLLLIAHDPGLERGITDITTYLAVAVIVGVVALIARHWWRATRAARHVMTPVLWAAGPAAAYFVMREIADLVTLSPTAERFVYEFMPLGLAVVPLGFLVGLLRTRLAYAQVGALLPELSGPVPPGRVRAALATTLHDPELELLYWSPISEEHVDIDGQPREPVAAPGRTVAAISGERGPLAVMMVDEVALQEPALLRAVGAMARLALENERLQAEVRGQLAQLRSTTARLMEAGQDARRRIERDLHDGAQQRLLALLREGLAHLLGEAGIEVTQAVGDADTLLAAVDAEPPEVVVTDIRMPPTFTDEGLTAALTIRSRHPDVAVLVLSQYLEAAYAERLLRSNASGAGYLLKDRVNDVRALCDAIVRVARGESVVDPEVIRTLVGRPRLDNPLDRLTEREREILALMAEGWSNQGIGDRLLLSAKTVEGHVGSIMAKLQIADSRDENRRVLAVVRYLRG
jgi:DNA-binding NarL/FixJ family response regulator